MRAVAEAVIDRPREAVFEYMDVPENQARISPRLSRVETLGVLDNGGKRARYTYRLGFPFRGEVRGVVHEPPERIVFELSGDIEGRLQWTFETVDDRTLVTYAADYDFGLPPILDRVLGPIAARYNRRELERTLANLDQQLSEPGDA
ncbi:SRPBCC family protein [Halobellus inordinatus]|uniref:SRPBCC family protein n=1 Tax=Halobellus inordinatus TaxID=1126236 RepID=UPI0031B895FC